MPSTVICQRCHEINEPNATVCQKCGARFCPHCHLLIPSPDAAICPHCGKKDLSFRPGKYSAGSVAASTVAPGAMPASRYVCPSCGNRIDPSLGKCPYCGQLGNRFTMMPTQGHGVMKPAQGDYAQTFTAPPPAEEEPTTQKVCSKCGRVIPPGSSLCPVHGKFGGGNALRNITPPVKDKTFEGEVYRRMEERKAGPAPRSSVRQVAPEEIYPQMQAVPTAPEGPEAPSEQRTCPNCGNAVPDRSKVCPTCGNNRLPPERSKPFMKAEDRYRAVEAAQQAYAYPPPQQAYAAYSAPEQSQYYGQPAVQPYEMAYPVPSPGFVEEIYPEKKRGKERRPRERQERTAKPGQRSSPIPILLALIALVGVIVIGVVFLVDQLKTPAPAVINNPPITTPSGTTEGPEISDVEYSNITRTGATVTWKTDKKSNSLVIYCINGGTLCENARDEALVTDHIVNLTNLKEDTSYHITVKSALGNDPDSADSSLEVTSALITLNVPDTTPPVLSNVKVSNLTSSGSAEITWNTDEPATSQVSYGTSAGYGTLQPSQTDTQLTTFHDVILNGLAPQTTFHYKVISRDAAGNEKSSADATFATPVPAGSSVGNSAPDFTLNCADGSTITLHNLQGKKVIINFWHTNCNPCMTEMPLLEEMHEKYPEIPMLVIHGTALGSINEPYVGSLITDNNYTFTVPLDNTGQVGALYSVTSIPKTFFLDSNGIIRATHDVAFTGLSQIEDKLNSY
ncbi:MAG: redoxin domain-containing protein [Dehalococcoidia bacterium]|nr:redoxin domain-containing protein [Dehalococcoidia bacterium]